MREIDHSGSENESRETAALYALGALGQHEARAFEEHLSEGCAACASELSEFERVVPSLALAAPPANPRESVRERLLSRIAEDEAATPRRVSSREIHSERTDFLIVRSDEGKWLATPDKGVSVKILFVDKDRDTVTTLVRMEPGARMPPHRHRGVEQCLVLEGDVSSGGHKMGPGDFNCSLTGSIHDELRSDGGALLFIVAPESYELLAH